MVNELQIIAEKGGVLKLKNPFTDVDFSCSQVYQLEEDNIVIESNSGDTIIFKINHKNQ